MRELFRKFFHKPTKETGFSEFFRDVANDGKKKFLERVVREANKDQRDLVDKYNKLYSRSN